MYTTIIHPLRKAYCLSINEYCILEAIRGLANNTKYEGWCVMSIPRIAKALDLSDSTLQRAYQKLEQVGLIERRKETPSDTAVRSVDEWNEWFMADKADILLSMKSGGKELTTIQLRKSQPPATSGVKLTPGVVASCDQGGVNLLPNTNRDTNNDTIISKEITEGASEPQKKDYGSKEINEMLIALKSRIGISAFVDSRIERNIAKHCVGLLQRIGKDEFVRRLDIILEDTFHHKNCNKILYVYNQIKGFIEPKIKSRVGVIS